MNMCPSYKRKLPPELCLKGQVYFIWSSPQTLQIASEKIPVLGGRIEAFLSKQITTILIENTYVVAAQQFCNDLTFRASYAPHTIVGSSYGHPGVLYNLPSTSRGYKFLTSTNTSSYDNILLFARQWEIPILELSNFLSSIEPFVKSISTINHTTKKNQNISNLTGCFIKFECYHKKFRPCYKMFSNDPERLMPLRNANVLIKAENCNVILDKPTGPRQLHPNHMDLNNRLQYRAQDSKPTVKDKKLPKLKPKEENNYCECCRTHFNDLKTHIKSANHQKFVSNEKNYESVNNILKMLPSPQEFIQKHQIPDQASNIVLFNGNVMHNKNTSLMADLPIPLNMHIKNESPIHLNVHDKQPEEILLPLNRNIKKDESPSPLNLHINQKEEIKQESPATHMEPSPLSNDNSVKSEIDVVGIKPDSPLNDDIVDCKDLCLPGVTNELLLESCAVDPILDKTNTATLAQLCIKNFENCWMENIDNLPDMDDMMFDDNIFDFDDCKSKADENECPDQENFSPEMNSPAFASGISTDLKPQSNANTSIPVNNAIDLKDAHVKVEEAVNSLDAFSPICKRDTKYPKSLSPPNLGFNESLINDKININKNFDMKSNAGPFYIDKTNINVSPSCSNPIPVKVSEQMFSSESSDDENENLISNALNMINSNSDNEMKTDRDNFEDISKSMLQQEEHISVGNLKESGSSDIELNGLQNSGYSPVSNLGARNSIKCDISSANSPTLPCVSSPIINVAVSNQNNKEISYSDSTLVSCASYIEMMSRSPPERVCVSSTVSNPVVNIDISNQNIKEMTCAESNVMPVNFSKIVNRSSAEGISTCNAISNPVMNTDLSTCSMNEIASTNSNAMPLDFSKVINQNSCERNTVSNPIINVDVSDQNIKGMACMDNHAMPIDFSNASNNQNPAGKVNASDTISSPVDVDMSDQSIKEMAFNDNNINLDEFENVINRNALERTNVLASDLANQNQMVSNSYLDAINHIRHQLDNEIRNSAFSNVSSVSMSDGINSPVAINSALPRRNMVGNSTSDNVEMSLMKNTEGICVNNSETAGVIPSEISNKDLSCNSVCYPLQTQTNNIMPGYICNVQQTCTESFKPLSVRNSVQNCVKKMDAHSISINKRISDDTRHRDSFCDYNKEKNSQSLEKMSCNSSEQDAHTKKEILMMQSHSPCTKAQSFEDTPKTKIPHKKNTRKLRKLPSLWSVSILPGKGLKLKFTCLQPESLVTVESDEEGAQPVKHRECK
ncbi:uncharacterized protein LOC129959183 [Argiope bruennichi]|uniref:uncharacterized protein LOC129959183 n=1 Tax=Argiope bruennichi TaxID=94029 RepID=UPI002495A318|nr:uncharacterized protein LOC129959183 [Argiope bruennichi]